MSALGLLLPASVIVFGAVKLVETGSFAAARCAWESDAGKPGLTLADSAERSLRIGAERSSLPI